MASNGKRKIKNINKITICAVVLIFLITACVPGNFSAIFRKFPKKSGTKQITLNALYRGQKVILNETLYRSVDEYYSSEPKKETFGNDYGSFVFSYQEDKTIEALTQKIIAKGKELGLSMDETMDLATSFVQNIPYDEEKGKIVLSNNPERVEGDSKVTLGRFPYETLYDNKGICTDKSYLLAAILKEMGYGTSLLVFNKERHMAVGVKTPTGYTSFNTKYGYLETTNTGYKVGQLPAVDKNIGGAKNLQIKNFTEKPEEKTDFLQQIPPSNFSAPSGVSEISDGKQYLRIIDITNNLNRIKELIPDINIQVKEIMGLKDELNIDKNAVEKAKSETDGYAAKLQEAESSYKANPTPANYSYYSKVYSEYNSNFYKTKDIVGKYNYKINYYNSRTTELNALINEYNELIKRD